MRKIATISTTAVALISTVAAPAQANVEIFQDETRQNASAIDIRQVTVDNSTTSPKKVIAAINSRALELDDQINVYYDTRRGDPGPEFYLAAGVSSEYAFRRVENWRNNGTVTTCRGDDVRAAAGATRVRVAIPRHCMDNPGRVRVAVHYQSTDDTRQDWARARHRWLGWVSR